MENRVTFIDLDRYNPEGSALRRTQNDLFGMLKVLAGICDENGIRWWLSSGTLLGAARHQGFIPWDDDVDIVMLKEDYLRLEQILLEMDDEEYVLHSMKTDPDYTYVYGKFRRREGECESRDPRYPYYKWKGAFIDIFAIEKTCYPAAQLSRFFYKVGHKMTTPIRSIKVRKCLTGMVNFVNFRILFPFFRFIGRINPDNQYHYTLGTGFARSTFYEEDIFPLKRMSFEGEMLPVPKDTDAYLTRVYGDWRRLPDEKAVKKAIHSRIYREEIFGKDN